MDERFECLFLNEAETVECGSKDMKRCIEVMEEMFELMAEGDYLMGSPNRNAHGIKIYFPKESRFPNMPLKGPDRRFMALVAYLGGRFNICGEKWYGSNVKNKDKGLPRSILTVLLNDADTGIVKVLMSANSLSATRTGAVAGVGAKHLSDISAKTVSAVGLGVIGRSCLDAALHVLETVEEVYLFDIDKKACEAYAQELEKRWGISVKVTEDVEEAVRKGDVINLATSGGDSPYIRQEWIKRRALLIFVSDANIEESIMTSSNIVVDNWKMYEAYAQELEKEEGSFADNLSGICGYLMDLVWEKKISRADIVDISELVCNKNRDHLCKKDRTVFIMDGMPVEDVAWAYEIYQNALKRNIGTRLNFWG
ncbi:MAG: tyramine oxidase subunit B [Filifactor alocis]|nr:tyramine oxidase subunit B [Filifactor alocis]